MKKITKSTGVREKNHKISTDDQVGQEEVCQTDLPSPMVAEFANLRAMEKKFKEWNPNQA